MGALREGAGKMTVDHQRDILTLIFDQRTFSEPSKATDIGNWRHENVRVRMRLYLQIKPETNVVS